ASQFNHLKAHHTQHPMAMQQYQHYPQQPMINPFAVGPYVAYNDGRTGIEQFNQMNDFYGNTLNTPNGYPSGLPSVGPLSVMGHVSGIGMGMGAGMGYQGPNGANAGMMVGQSNNMYRAMGTNGHGRGSAMGTGFTGSMSPNQAGFNGMHIIPSVMSNG